MSPIASSAILVSFPVAASVAGSVTAVVTRPSARVTSGIQHFAAGVVFAAVAVEILPDLRDDGHLALVVASFAIGVGVLLGLGQLAARLESRSTDAVVPLGLVVAVGIDLLIDGLLVGVGASLGRTEGIILTVALTLEILFLSLSVSAGLQARGAGARTSALVPSALSLLTVVGAVGGAALLADAGTGVLAAVLAFGAAALLYLVTEELLVEAHEVEETPLLAAMFFVGFIIIFALAA